MTNKAVVATDAVAGTAVVAAVTPEVVTVSSRGTGIALDPSLMGPAPERYQAKTEAALAAVLSQAAQTTVHVNPAVAAAQAALDKAQAAVVTLAQVRMIVAAELDAKAPGTSAAIPAAVLDMLVNDRVSKMEAQAAMERMAATKTRGNSSPGLARFASEKECTAWATSDKGFGKRKFRMVLQGQTANGEWVNVPGYDVPFAVYAAGNKKSDNGDTVQYAHMRDEVQSKLIANDGTEVGICSIVAVHIHTPWRK